MALGETISFSSVLHNGFVGIHSSRTTEPRNSAGHPGEPAARPEVALPWPELRPRGPGGLVQAEAILEEGHAPYPQAQCADGRRTGAHDPGPGTSES